jgi:hypothetical protein
MVECTELNGPLNLIHGLKWSILDREALKKNACGCYNALQHTSG